MPPRHDVRRLRRQVESLALQRFDGAKGVCPECGVERGAATLVIYGSYTEPPAGKEVRYRVEVDCEKFRKGDIISSDELNSLPWCKVCGQTISEFGCVILTELYDGPPDIAPLS